MGCCTTNDQMCKACCWLVLIGALNMGLVGLGSFLGQDLDVLNMLLGGMPKVEAIVYVLIGLAAVYKIVKTCKKCS